MYVKPKKHLGQHFLTDEKIAERIADALSLNGYSGVLEIGPGKGILTSYLLEKKCNLKVVEIDDESVQFLTSHFPKLDTRIIKGDFLELDLGEIFASPFGVIGNFPYNISTEILFKILEDRNKVTEVVGMFQKEVAERVASKPGNKNYGIPSVLLQAYYDVEYLFTVGAEVFNPPPKVQSGVIRMRRNSESKLLCNERDFKTVVKTGFNQRRKTLRNSLKSLFKENYDHIPYLDKRPEQLTWQQFQEITLALSE